MSTLKVFRIKGEIRKPNLETHFAKEVVAVKQEHAIEKVYAELGSRHRAKRFQIKILSVEEIKPEEIENPILKKLVVGEERIGE
ncbi:MAG: 50S ribosomal protein L18Ae [Candidatus Bathyarchaeia archaeon]